MITSTLGKALRLLAASRLGPGGHDYLTQRAGPRLYLQRPPTPVAASALASIQYLEAPSIRKPAPELPLFPRTATRFGVPAAARRDAHYPRHPRGNRSGNRDEPPTFGGGSLRHRIRISGSSAGPSQDPMSDLSRAHQGRFAPGLGGHSEGWPTACHSVR
jgi:hypothetical protein